MGRRGIPARRVHERADSFAEDMAGFAEIRARLICGMDGGAETETRRTENGFDSEPAG